MLLNAVLPTQVTEAYLAIVVGSKELHGRGGVRRARHDHMQQLTVLAALLMQVLDHLHGSCTYISNHSCM